MSTSTHHRRTARHQTALALLSPAIRVGGPLLSGGYTVLLIVVGQLLLAVFTVTVMTGVHVIERWAQR